MNRILLPSLMLSTVFLLAGCLQDPATQQQERLSANQPNTPISSMISDFHNSGPTEVWKYPSQISSWPLERQQQCNFGDIMTGYAVKNYNNGFNYLEVFCRTLDSSGSLGSTVYSNVDGTSPDPYEECYLPDVQGFVAVGLKVQVSGNNVSRCRIKRCAWNSSTKRVNTGNCYESYDGSSNNTGWELDWAVTSMPGAGGYSASQLVMVGFGIESYQQNVRQFRGDVGILK